MLGSIASRITAADIQVFSAACDKQIVVPNSSILYCSEAWVASSLIRVYSCVDHSRCRHADTYSSTPVSPAAKPVDRSSKPERDLIPPMSPTEVKHSFLSSRKSSHTSLADITGPYMSETSSSMTKRPSISRVDSEAAKYLSQFHTDPHVSHRPRSSRQSATPSLSGSPSSFASSLPFTPQYTSRSLGGTRFTATKSIELVTPTAAAPSAPGTLTGDLNEKLQFDDFESTPTVKYHGFDESEADADEKLDYAKRARTESGAASSSLKQLLKNAERGPGSVR